MIVKILYKYVLKWHVGKKSPMVMYHMMSTCRYSLYRNRRFIHNEGDKVVYNIMKIQHHDTYLCVYGYVEITHLYFHKRDSPNDINFKWLLCALC